MRESKRAGKMRYNQRGEMKDKRVCISKGKEDNLLVERDEMRCRFPCMRRPRSDGSAMRSSRE